MGKHTVFVYGTLMSGFWNHRLLEEGKAKSLGKATVDGTMYGMSVPIVDIKGKGIVHGELYQVGDQTLAKLDRLEGHHPGKTMRDYGYVRTEITTHGGAKAWIYALGGLDVNLWTRSSIIESGDYRAHREAIYRREMMDRRDWT